MKKTKVRVIIDTNLWISFLLSRDYKKLDRLFNNDNLVLIFSDQLLEEFLMVAKRPKFKKYFSVPDLENILRELYLRAEFIEVTANVIACRDTKDNFLLSLALDGKADFLISGDKDLLDITLFENTKIITIAEFLANQL